MKEVSHAFSSYPQLAYSAASLTCAVRLRMRQRTPEAAGSVLRRWEPHCSHLHRARTTGSSPAWPSSRCPRPPGKHLRVASDDLRAAPFLAASSAVPRLKLPALPGRHGRSDSSPGFVLCRHGSQSGPSNSDSRARLCFLKILQFLIQKKKSEKSSLLEMHGQPHLLGPRVSSRFQEHLSSGKSWLLLYGRALYSVATGQPSFHEVRLC